KYVNMADLTVPVATDRAFSSADRAGRGNEPIWDVIELLFFAYRDFIGDPDDVLAELGFVRAHHRVLHFVNGNPGMKVAELLDILKITKQSLGRVLKQLIDQGYVVQKEGANDRRQRLLYVTAKGETLAMKLAGLQTARIARALSDLGPNAHEAACPFLPPPWPAPPPGTPGCGPWRALPARGARGANPGRGGGTCPGCPPLPPPPPPICWWSTMTAASALCSRASCSPKAIASP